MKKTLGFLGYLVFLLIVAVAVWSILEITTNFFIEKGTQKHFEEAEYLSGFGGTARAWNGCTPDTRGNQYKAYVFYEILGTDEDGNCYDRFVVKCYDFYPNPNLKNTLEDDISDICISSNFPTNEAHLAYVKTMTEKWGPIFESKRYDEYSNVTIEYSDIIGQHWQKWLLDPDYFKDNPLFREVGGSLHEDI